MAQITKKAIIDCTIELAKKKPVNKIKIKDIVDNAGITRNTFYYYFHDIYDVLDSVLDEQLIAALDPKNTDSESATFKFIEFCVMYKPVWKNLYKAMGGDALAKYVSKKLHKLILGYIERESGGKHISNEDKNIICAFYEEALFGVMMRWIRGEMGNTEELQHKVEKIEQIFDGNMKFLINNCK